MQIGRLDAQHSHLPDQLHFGEILNVGISWNFIRDCQEPWSIDSQLISSNWGHCSGQHWRLFSHWRHFWDCRAWFKGGTEMGQGGCRPASNVKSKFAKIYSFSSLKLLHIENSHARVVGSSIWFTTQKHSAFVQVAAARWSLQPGTKCWARGSDRALVGGIWCERRCLWCPWTAKRGIQFWTAKEGIIMWRVLDLSSIYCSFRVWQGLLWVYFGSIWGLQGCARMLVRKRRSDRKSSVLWNGTVFHRQTLVDSLSSVKNPSSWEFASAELLALEFLCTDTLCSMGQVHHLFCPLKLSEVMFFKMGQWEWVIIDDLVPMSPDDEEIPLFANCKVGVTWSGQK